METKICFKCGKEKPTTEFYKHKAMHDGYLGKCKECTKNDVKEKHRENSENPAYVEKERARGREKYKRLGYKEKYYDNAEERFVFRKTPLFKGLHKKMVTSGLIVEFEEAHHWNYNNPYSVIVLTRSFHKRIHQTMVLDEETLCYKTLDGELLDSLSRHVQHINSVATDFRVYSDLTKHFK